MGCGVEHGPLGAGAVSEISALIASLTREVADFPSPGIQFKDLSPLFADHRGFAAVTDALAEVASGTDLVAGVDARGFLLAGAVALRLGTGVLAVRKGGKLPPPVLSETYDLEYGTATLEIPADGIELAGPQRRHHRRRFGHRGHGCGHGAAAQEGRRDGHWRRGGAGTGRAKWPRRAQTSTCQQLAHGLSGYPRSLR